MKVTLISQYYPPEQGAVRYSWHVAKGLAARGHEITVIAGLPHFPTGKPHAAFGRFIPKIRVEESVRVIRTPMVMGSNTQSLCRIFGFISFSISALLWAVLGPRTDVIIASVPPATSAVSGSIASWIRGCPFIVILRDIEPWRALKMRGWDGRASGRAFIALFMWIYRRARQVVVMHEREVPYLVEQGVAPGRIKVVPHGVDFAHPPCPNDSPPRIPRRPGRSLFLYAGTIGLVHGVHQFLEALAEPRIRRLPIDVVIIGDGQYKPECRRIVEARNLENVSLLPAIPPEQVAGALAQADVLVCCFRDGDDIPLCSKFYEYCSAGKPILVYGTNLAGDMVRQIGNGVSCAADNTGSQLAAVSDLVTNSEEWRRRGLQGRAYAQEHFSQVLRDEQWEQMLGSQG
ncbi:MAG: glycosyltransferase family 4 protein [candidate division Zixibacteria bacterium]|nr:glycosyltransferase family 4 protein [candidate division Zixibacteria bacterium]